MIYMCKVTAISYCSSIQRLLICRTNAINCGPVFGPKRMQFKRWFWYHYEASGTNHTLILDLDLPKVFYNLLYQKTQRVIFMQRKWNSSKSYFHHFIFSGCFYPLVSCFMDIDDSLAVFYKRIVFLLLLQLKPTRR